jgi:hypothetical protein
MRIEVTEHIGKGRCTVQTEWCHARACGVVGSVRTPDGTYIMVCGACLEEMADTGAWHIPGTRPTPPALLSVLNPGDCYTPKPGALLVERMCSTDRGRCEVRTEVCEAREWGLITVVTMPDCRDVWLCGACLEKMAVSGEWDLGWSGGASVAEMKRLAQFKAAAPAA